MSEETLAPACHPVHLLAGAPEPGDIHGDIIEIDCGCTRLVGLDGLRLLLRRLDAIRPAATAGTASEHRPEWNVLFPGTFPDSAPMSALASTCSERRLHAESEQIFRVIVVAGRAVVRAAAGGELTIVLRRAAQLDLPSMRAIPHLAERAAMSRVPVRLLLTELDLGSGSSPGEPDNAPADGHADGSTAQRLAIRRGMLASLTDRLGGLARHGASAPRPLPAGGAVPPSRDRRLLDLLTAGPPDTEHSTEDTVAAAIGLMRAAFFSTDHDTGVLAAHRLLAELDRHPGLDVARVRSAVESLDLGDDPGSIGVDAAAVIDHAALRSLAHRYLGMVHVFVLDYATALRHLAQASTAGPGFVRARARLLRALLLIKRVGDVPAGFAEVAAGMADLAGDGSPATVVEQAWLHNVKALGHVQLREPDAAMAEERAAVRLIGKLSSTDATHLKVNLVSNISVLREYAHRPDAAVDVWRRFSRRSTAWGDTFFKHHAYREGGLLVRAGAVDEALAVLDESYWLARSAGDEFYCGHMALERGRLLLDLAAGDASAVRPSEQAGKWFARAGEHATAVGDPYLLALARSGAGLAGQTGIDADLRAEAAGLARASLAHQRQGEELVAALTGGDDRQVLACLPMPRTKLNRPFHAVRLELRERR